MTLPFNFLKLTPVRSRDVDLPPGPLRPPKRMAFRVRSSKYRHVFGSVAKKEHCYECIKISKNAHDSNCCAVNPKYIAIVTEAAGGGSFVVLPIEKTGRVDINSPKVCGHSGQVLDIKWNPFNDDIIASCSDDATVKLWQIPADGLRTNLTEWIMDLHGHQRRVGYIEWHPTAESILLSAAYDFRVILWNTATAEPINIVTVHPDTIFSIAWNRDGSLFATTCKDKMIRVFDARDGNVVAEGLGHQGSKASKVVFVGDADRIFTTGFSRMSERQYAIWDMSNMSKPLKIETVDCSSGVLLPYYDYDTRVMFLAGKGDGNIRYYEIVNDPPYGHFLSQYQSGSPQRSLGMMPKRGVDPNKCEIVRFFKLHTCKDLVEPISMIVPRKSEMFQEDIFPPTASACPSLTTDEWLSGQNREPILISLQDGALCHAPTITTYRAVKRTSQHEPGARRTPLAPAAVAPTPLPVEKLPASVRNIKKLSEMQVEGSRVNTDVSNRINVFENRKPVNHLPTTRLTNANEPNKVDKKVWSSNYTPPLTNEVIAVSNGPLATNMEPITFHQKVAAPSSTPSNRKPTRTDSDGGSTPFYTAVKAPRTTSYPGSPSDFSTPVRGMLFTDGRADDSVFRTPPSSPRRMQFNPHSASERWNQNPLYVNDPPASPKLKSQQNFSNPSSPKVLTAPPQLLNTPTMHCRPELRSPCRPLTVDTTQLDAILHDMEWSAQPPAKVCISPQSRHRLTTDQTSVVNRPESYPGVGVLEQRRHSITSCDPNQPSWMMSEAPDNTLIKPSKLRESQRDRRARSVDKENGEPIAPISSTPPRRFVSTDSLIRSASDVGHLQQSSVGYQPPSSPRFKSDCNLRIRPELGLAKPKVRRTGNRRQTSVDSTTSDEDSKVHVRKVWSPHSAVKTPDESLISQNGCPSTDPELRKAYFRQVDEIRSLKERLALKDKRIWQLEEELRLMHADENIADSSC